MTEVTAMLYIAGAIMPPSVSASWVVVSSKVLPVSLN